MFGFSAQQIAQHFGPDLAKIIVAWAKLPDDRKGRMTAIAEKSPTDPLQHSPELALVIRAWADLPDAVRAGILAMVEASR